MTVAGVSPAELERTALLGDGESVFVRPIRPDDGPGHGVAVEQVKVRLDA